MKVRKGRKGSEGNSLIETKPWIRMNECGVKKGGGREWREGVEGSGGGEWRR